MKMTKKLLIQKKQKGENAHWEGKYFCGCRIRNFRQWLGIKKYGHENIDGDNKGQEL